jgi:hypothetical protein
MMKQKKVFDIERVKRSLLKGIPTGMILYQNGGTCSQIAAIRKEMGIEPYHYGRNYRNRLSRKRDT